MIRAVIDTSIVVRAVLKPLGTVGPILDLLARNAVEGHADALVSGDEDLLVLHPFQGIPIVQPAQFLAMLD